MTRPAVRTAGAADPNLHKSHFPGRRRPGADAQCAPLQRDRSHMTIFSSPTGPKNSHTGNQVMMPNPANFLSVGPPVLGRPQVAPTVEHFDFTAVGAGFPGPGDTLSTSTALPPLCGRVRPVQGRLPSPSRLRRATICRLRGRPLTLLTQCHPPKGEARSAAPAVWRQADVGNPLSSAGTPPDIAYADPSPATKTTPGCVGYVTARGVFPLRDCGEYMKLALLRKVKGNAVLYILGGLFGCDISGEIAVGFFYDSVGHFI